MEELLVNIDYGAGLRRVGRLLLSGREVFFRYDRWYPDLFDAEPR